jgi:cytochrome c553
MHRPRCLYSSCGEARDGRPALFRAGQRLYRGGNRASPSAPASRATDRTDAANSAGGIPALERPAAHYTAAQLKAYAPASGAAIRTQIMRNIAALMSPDDIAAVASYVQGLH